MCHDKKRKSQNFLTAQIICGLLLLIFGTQQTAHAASIGNDNANNDTLALPSSNITSIVTETKTDTNTDISTTSNSLAEHATILPYSISNDMKTTTAEPTIEHEATTLLNLPVVSAVNSVDGDGSTTSSTANFPHSTEEPLTTTTTTTTTTSQSNLLHDSSTVSSSTTSSDIQSNGESNCLRYIHYNEKFKFC